MRTSQNEKSIIPSLADTLHLFRLNRPIGIWLLFAPCTWGLALASPGFPSVWYLLLFLIGATLMRSAGCVYNDIVDRDLDQHVKRTKDRPLACKKISVFQAWIFICILSLSAFCILLQFPAYTIGLGISSLALVATYPWMKRITYWPQAVLGLAFNWGALMGWTSVDNQLHLPAFWLFLAGITWTLVYDTIYAHQDKEDDLMIGIKSTAVKWGKRTRPFLYVCSTLMLICLGLAGRETGLDPYRYLAGLTLIGSHLFWQCFHVNLDNPKDCLRKFKANQWLGILIFAAIAAAKTEF